jgi:hypothetical protein
MHVAILRAYPAPNNVIHTHADACVALACLGRLLPAFHYMITAFGGAEVRCARYATFGTPDLAASAVEALKDRTACLLANHGMIAVGGRSSGFSEHGEAGDASPPVSDCNARGRACASVRRRDGESGCAIRQLRRRPSARLSDPDGARSAVEKRFCDLPDPRTVELIVRVEVGRRSDQAEFVVDTVAA